MKVLFPIGSFYPAQSGGPSNTIYWHAKALKKNGINTTVVTTSKDIKGVELNTFVKTDAGDVIYCSEISFIFSFKLIFHTLKKLKQTDIIHLTSLFYFPSLIIAFFSLLHKKKIVWSVRGELEKNALRYHSFYKKFYIKLIKMMVNQNVTFHTTSVSESKNTKQIFSNSKVTFFPNYIDLAKLEKSNSKKQLLFLGRIHPIKNIEGIIKSLSMSKEFEKQKFKLLIAGEGKDSYLDKIKLLVKEVGLIEQVIFLGPVVGVKKQELLAQSYGLILASYSENFGNVVVESLAQKTPVIATKGTPWELLDTYSAGFWIENTHEALSNSIDKLLSLNEHEYRKIRENAYNLVTTEFDIDRNIQKWIEYYKKKMNE